MDQVTSAEFSAVPPAPGDVLRDRLLSDGRLSQAELARAIGISAPRLNMMLKGRCQITAEIALRLERVFGISPYFWLRLRDEFELFEERQRMFKTLAALSSLDQPKGQISEPWVVSEIRVAA